MSFPVFAVFALLAVLGAVFLVYFFKKVKEQVHSEPVKLVLPPFPASPGSKVAIQTYVDKSRIPAQVGQAWEEFASEYTRYLFDDEDIRAMMKSHFPPNVLETFDKIQAGAHKADLFRYCALYLFGGLYMDIKTELVKPLSEVFTDPHKMYIVVSDINPGTIYNGIIYSPPGNPILYDLIVGAVHTDPAKLSRDYFTFIRQMYEVIKEKYLIRKEYTSGLNKTIEGVPDIYVLREVGFPSDVCEGVLDRYNVCSWITDHDQRVIKTRYADYPWH